jgi:hypothetical protein
MSESQLSIIILTAAGLAVLLLIIVVGAMLVAFLEARNGHEEHQG